MVQRKWYIPIILTLIFILAIVLRCYNLGSFPVGFHLDEASKGYTAYSLLKTGKDDNGNILPLYIDIFGDNSPAGYHYVTLITVAVFGLTEVAVRLPGAIIGALTVLVCYFFTRVVLVDKRVSMMSALLLAIAPWHINLSRASSEAVIALFLIMLGFTLVIFSVKSQKLRPLFLGIIALFFSFLFYQTPRMFVPLFFTLFLFATFFIRKEQFPSRFKRIFIISFLVLCLADMLLIFGVPGGTGRFSQVNIFTYPETTLVLEEQIRENGLSGTHPYITRIFHNKLLNNFQAYTSNYLEYFSWNFLFMKGLPNWYFVPNMGVMYFVSLPFVLLGIFTLLKQKETGGKVALLWLLIGPTVAAVAIDVNNLQRAIVMFPMLEIIAAAGIVFFLSRFRGHTRRLVITLTVMLFFCNFLYFMHQYFVHTKVHRPWYRYNGFAEMVTSINKSYDEYDAVIITKTLGGVYPLVQFYTRYDPRKYQLEGSPKDVSYGGFGKFYFVPEECPLMKNSSRYPDKEKMIFVNSGRCREDVKYKRYIDQSGSREEVIHREDGTEAFSIVYVQ